MHSKICISFCEDSFVVSFGEAKRFHEEDGKGSDRYLEWLKAKIIKDPESVVHVWEDNKIVGQIEMGRMKEDPSFGYVSRYYLIPEKRGQGFGALLDQHAMGYFKKLGLSKVRLSVSPSNAVAISFYKKMGWVDMGPRPGHPHVHLMEKKI
jgi:ribosomal protein S18 acetylase RimI-like enzyme